MVRIVGPEGGRGQIPEGRGNMPHAAATLICALCQLGCEKHRERRRQKLLPSGTNERRSLPRPLSCPPVPSFQPPRWVQKLIALEKLPQSRGRKRESCTCARVASCAYLSLEMPWQKLPPPYSFRILANKRLSANLISELLPRQMAGNPQISQTQPPNPQPNSVLTKCSSPTWAALFQRLS